MKDNTPDNVVNHEIILTKEEALILAEDLKKKLQDGEKPQDDIEQIKKLISGLGDERGLLRRTFAETLGLIGVKAIPELRTALLESTNVTVRRAAAKTLKLVGNPIVLPDLFKALLEDKDPVVQGSSAGAIAIFGEKAVFYFLEVIKNPNASSLQCGLASWGLAFIGSEGSEALKKAAKSNNAKIRSSAIAALGEQIQALNDEEAKGIVKDSLEDSSIEVQVEAIKLIDIFPKEEINFDILASKIKSEEPEVRKQVALTLMRINAIDQLNLLESRLREEKDSHIISILKLAINNLRDKNN